MKDSRGEEVRPGYYVFGGEPSVVYFLGNELVVKTIRTEKPLTAEVRKLGTGDFFNPQGLQSLTDENVGEVIARRIICPRGQLIDPASLEAYANLFAKGIPATA